MPIEYRVKPTLQNEELNALMNRIWNNPEETNEDFQPMLKQSLTYVGAFIDEKLVGFVNVAWDGSDHAFILNTSVDPKCRRKGIGSECVRVAVEESEKAGMTWLHVDYEPEYRDFYQTCGFRHTEAGLIKLK